MRFKEKTGPQKKSSKAEKIRKEKFTRNRTWKDFTAEDEAVQNILVGRPRKFKSPEELLKLFNDYILTCVEKEKVSEKIPVETVIQSKEAKDGSKNKLITEYQILEKVKRIKTPTKGGFCIFLGGIPYKTLQEYKTREEFSPVLETIDNYLESILVEHAGRGFYDTKMAQFVLNTTYNRVPKSKSEVVEKSEPLNESDFIRD